MAELGAAQERPLILESTRSHAGEDAWRDMDGFDLDEELARLRRAVHEVRTHYLPDRRPRYMAWVLRRLAGAEHAFDLLGFIAEAFTNIDETLVRLGPLPRAWFGSSSLNPLRYVARATAVSINLYEREGVLNGELDVRLISGLRLIAPLEWFPQFRGASADQIRNWRLVNSGTGIQWPELDIDLSIRGLIMTQHEIEDEPTV